MSIASVTTPLAQLKKPWYKEPYVWMVVGGPLAVVLASLFTVYLAVTHPDKVLQRTKGDAEGGSVQQSVTRAQEVDRSALPAMEARNHVASPTIRTDK